MLMKLTPVVNFINVILAAFILADPKSARKAVKLNIDEIDTHCSKKW